MRWSAFFAGTSIVFCLYQFTLSFCNSSAAAGLALAFWFFSGGMGWLEIFDNGPDPNFARTNYIFTMCNFEVGAFWFQTMTHLFQPQRCATFGLPLCLVTFLALFDGVRHLELNFFVLAALAVGILPQVQVHAYLAMALFSLALSVATFPFAALSSRKALLCWAAFGCLANAIALPLCWPMLTRVVETQSFVRYAPIYRDMRYTKKPFPFLQLWWRALGVFGGVALVFGFVSASAFQIRFYSAALVVFIVGNLYLFQPWALDNCKVFHSGWFPVATAFVANYFVFVWNRAGWIVRVVLVILFGSCLAAGIFSHLNYERIAIPIGTQSQVATGEWVSENTPRRAVFTFSGEPDCPIAIFGGRSLIKGWSGWMINHGLEDGARTALANALETGGDYGAHLREGVHYLYRRGPGRPIGPNVPVEELEPWSLVMDLGPIRIFRLLTERLFVETTRSSPPKKRRRH
jgi:hypothetical protein